MESEWNEVKNGLLDGIGTGLKTYASPFAVEFMFQ